MRILALRGRNLASLAEPFDVDLEAEPLRSAGLFAITGETGAGKSTLLDALCLALYGMTPRLEAKGSDEDVPDASGKTIKATDDRSVLRRGASEGDAEVDFVGVDGRRYRARWAVRRARGKAAGRLQAVERMVFHLPDAAAPVALADGATAVEAEIVRLTDLTFKQFRRTALLAQGDFDAFLHANEAERADLLEKITGTDIYGRISRGVFAQAREAGARLEALRLRLGEVIVLDAEGRAALDAQIAALGETLREAELVAGRLEGERQHRLALDGAALRVARGQEALAAEQARQDAGSGDRDLLRQINLAAPLRPLVQAIRDAEASHLRAQGLEQEATAALAEAEVAASTAAEAEAASTGALAAAAATEAGFEPAWAQASELDTQIATASAEVARARSETAAAGDAVTRQSTSIRDLERNRNHLLVDRDAISTKLSADARIAGHAENWPGQRALITEHGTLVTTRRAALGDQERAARERKGHEDRLVALAADLSEKQAQKDQIEESLAAREEALAVFDEADLNAQRDGMRALEECRQKARAAAIAHVLAAAKVTRADAEGREAAGILAITGDRQSAVGAGRETLIEARVRQQSAIDLADAIEAPHALALRSVLVAGEPCPVCGALDHPVAGGDGLGALVARIRDERLALDREIDAANRLMAALAADLARETARKVAADGALVEAQADLSSEAAKYDALLPGLGADAPSIEGAVGFLDATAEAVLLHRAGIEQSLAGLRLLQADREALRKRLDAAAKDLTQLARDHAATTGALHASDLKLAAATQTVGHAEVRIADIVPQLAELLEAADLTPADLDRDATGIAARLDRQFATLATLRGQLEQSERALAALEPDLATARNALAVAQETARLAQQAADNRQGVWQQLNDMRSGLLDGEATETHRSRYRAAVDTARRQFDAAAAKAGLARVAVAAARALLEARQRAVEEAAVHLAARDEAYHLARVASTLGEEDALRLLAIAPETRTALAERIEAAATALAVARQSLDAAVADEAMLIGQGVPERDAAAIQSAIEAVRAEMDACNQQLGEARAMVAADDAAALRLAGIDAEMEAAKAEWAIVKAVDDAIGSADGAKFRRFAQSLTLDHLVTLANQHLATLTQRYRLRRAEGGGLGLHIIDRDMGDEVRSTRTLSGGERFLASLALALALSNLEGRRSFIDTLFIDEGFGTLDAATLDVALDALETLQSQGRKVGVISHVTAMIERIAVQVRVEKAGSGRSVVRVGLQRGS